MQPENQDDLQWLAFRYAVGEMSLSESEEFEARLTDDQSAREAVAEAVELNEAAALLPREVFSEAGLSETRAVPLVASLSVGTLGPATPSRERSWVLAARWLAIGMAASLAAVFLYQAGVHWVAGRAERVAEQSTDPAGIPMEQLAMVWAQSHVAYPELPGPFDLTGRSLTDRSEEWTDSTRDESSMGENDEAANDSSDTNAPDWLLAAVSISAPVSAPAKDPSHATPEEK